MLGIEPGSERARQVLYPSRNLYSHLKIHICKLHHGKLYNLCKIEFFLKRGLLFQFLTVGTTGRRKGALLGLLRNPWSSAEKTPILHAFR